MKKERVKLAEILIASGFEKIKVLRVLRIPIAVKVLVQATAFDEHEVDLVLDNEKRINVKTPGKMFEPIRPLMPNIDRVESSVINDKSGDWSMSRSKITIIYSNGNQRSLFFGAAGTGPGTDPKKPLTHIATIPPETGWPSLKTDNPQYPITD